MAPRSKKPTLVDPTAEVVSEWPETPVTPFVPTPVEASEPVEAKTVASEPVPVAMDMTIDSIIRRLPEHDQPGMKQALYADIQQYITKVRDALVAESAKEVADIRDKLVTEARATIAERIKEISISAGPTNPAEMATLVSQEYLRFPVTVPVFDDEDNEREEHFVIRELPQAIEKHLVETVTSRIAPLLSKFQNVKFREGSSNAEKIQHIVKVIPEVTDLMSEATMICLNPFGKREGIDKAWVQNNLATSRMAAILEAQFMANRIRDFFYAVSRLSPRM